MNPQHGTMVTSEEIYEDLCLKIDKLVYMPGDRLSENELCRIYGVTRHVVRNALVSLKQRRLVDVFPQRGTYVSLIDMDYIEDILYIRESVEQEALARVMELADTSGLTARLKQCVKAQAEIPKGENYNEEFYTIDNLFHGSLLEAVGKPNVMSLISEPYIHVRRWRNYEIRSVQRMKEIVGEHRQLIEAIEKKMQGQEENICICI